MVEYAPTTTKHGHQIRVTETVQGTILGEVIVRGIH